MRINLFERVRAIRHALDGIVTLFRTQANSWIYLVCTVAIIVAGVALEIGDQQWIWLLVVVSLVWITELINTAVEFTCDLVTREHNELVRCAKDTAAGAVFIAAVAAVVVVAWVFWSAAGTG